MISESVRIHTALICYLSIAICHSGSAFGVDAGYLDAIKADVAEFTTHEFHPPASTDWLGNREGDTTRLMDIIGFSTFLQNESPGSFIFYKKLPNDYKERLHQDYLVTGDLDRIKQDIFKYTREVKK